MTATADQLLEAPTVALDDIRHHPANPRFDAVADTELVESVLAQGILDPLMVAPAFDGEGWVLIDGHRRLSAAQQAGLTHVPVNPRYDLITEAQQIEIMIITGLQKALLTPVEEAAGYEQLQLIGMDDVAIAKATGFSRARVRSRLKLNDLSEKVRTGVHEGQVTLADVEALAEFASNEKATATLEAALGTPSFRSTYHAVKSRAERDAENAATIAEVVALGAVEVARNPNPGGGVVAGDDVFPNTRTLMSLPAPLDVPAAHEGHLGWYVGDWDYATPSIYCLDTTTHPELVKSVPVDEADEESDWEKRRAEREAKRARLVAADTARGEWMAQHFAGLFPTKSHQGLAAFARAFLAAEDPDNAPEPNETPSKVLARFSSVLIDQAAGHFTDAPSWFKADDILPRLQMWDWLTGAGYKLSDVDVEIRTRLETQLAADQGDD